MLYNDLKYYLSDPGSYIIFIDDANQVTHFDYILDYVINPPIDINVKIVLTARDYALNKIQKVVCAKIIPQEEIINIIDEDGIRDILQSNLGIKNEDFLKQIVRISKGNARLAILAGKIAIEKGYLATKNATDIFRFYYGDIIEKEFGDIKKTIVAFIISFFGPFEYRTNRIAICMMQKYNIEENDFYLICHELNEKEIIDFFMNQVVKISDQSMGNYLLYYVLIEKQFITIAEILKIGFNPFQKKIIYALTTIINLFYSEECLNLIEKQVRDVWSSIEDDDEQFEYIKCFHNLDEYRSLVYIKSKIDIMEIEELDLQEFNIKSKMNNHSINSKYIEVLGEFRDSDSYKEVFELLIYYFKRRPAEVMDLYFIFTDRLGYGRNSYAMEYEKEIFNIEHLWNASKEGKEVNITILMLYIIKYYMKCEFDITESGEGRTLSIITFNLVKCEGLDKLRKIMWNILSKLYSNDKYTEIIEDIILNYHPYSKAQSNIQDIVEIDFKYAREYIFNDITIPTLNQCKILQHFEIICNRFGIVVGEVAKKYELNETFITYQTLTKTHEIGKDWREEEKERKNEISRMVKDYSEQDFIKLFSICKNILEKDKEQGEWSLRQGISLVFDTVKEKPEQYIMAIKAYLLCETPYCFDIDNRIGILIKYLDIDEIERKIISYDYKEKNAWLSAFLCSIPENLLCEKHVRSLNRLFDEEIEKEYPVIPVVQSLIKYQKLEKEIIYTFSNKLLRKTFYIPYVIENFLGRVINEEEIEKLFSIFKDSISVLENLYIIAIKRHIDFSGDLFIKLVKNDKNFIRKYIYNIISDKNYKNDYCVFYKVWEQENYKELIDIAFEASMNSEGDLHLFHRNHYLEKMFMNGENNTDIILNRKIERIKEYINKNCRDVDKLVVIFEVINEVLKTNKKELVLYLLSKNKDIEVFKSIPLFSWSSSWSSSEVPMIENKINYLNTLIDALNGIDYIEHKAYIKDIVTQKEKYKQNVLIREYTEDNGLE
ncbi:MAG: hypothetical protein A2Y24_00570 [Clostridiales bacterium GWE2_32_10]|nr:MAG: hypothetical protein A2Y24_00570 [Clostridiales bacterium GWE2_32_10]HBY21247.1 hypothetical protein [Clostridiales bacterium]